MPAHHIRRIGPVLVSIGLVAVLAAPATARSHERRIEVQDGATSVEELCGEMWTVTTTSRDVITLKEGPHGGPPSFSDNYRFTSVYTDPADSGRGFVLSGNGLFKDVRVQSLHGTVYEFTSIDVGRRLTISTLGGRAVASDRGRLTWTFVVETHGSSNPDDYELLDATLAAAKGPHPIFDSGDEGCGMIAEITG